MPPGSHTFRVVKGSAKPGRCRDCRHPIVWAVAVTRKGAKALPFSKEPFYAPTERADTGVVYERWPSDLLHFISCSHARPRTGARA